MSDLTKDEAMKIARDQYLNHASQTSGVWSVSEDRAKEICKVLEVDYEECVDYQRQCEDEDSYRLAGEKQSEVSAILSDAGIDMSEDFWSELSSNLMEKYESEGYNSPSYSEYFWDQVTTMAVTS